LDRPRQTHQEPMRLSTTWLRNIMPIGKVVPSPWFPLAYHLHLLLGTRRLHRCWDEQPSSIPVEGSWPIQRFLNPSGQSDEVGFHSDRWSWMPGRRPREQQPQHPVGNATDFRH
jgi:hypothetical protein